MSPYAQLRSDLQAAPRKWLVTGVAGFIGSNLLEELLKLDQEVVGLDNFSNGKQSNLDEVRQLVTPAQWARFRFMEGDITDLPTCGRACAGMDYVLHQAAIGSVPRSLLDPIRYHHSNVTGFLNMLVAARDARVKRFVYASSSSVYGDDAGLPRVEHKTGSVLSPYAATKVMNEVYAGVFQTAYQFETIGLRYFNVFGPRQDPDGAYAAVIPKWIAALLTNEPVQINGDGETSRDFCFVADVVQANLLAATAGPEATNQVYNIAVGERTTLNELYRILSVLCLPQSALRTPHSTVLSPDSPSLITDDCPLATDSRTPHSVLRNPHSPVPLITDNCPLATAPDSAICNLQSAFAPPVQYLPFRPGDIRHSLADISKAQKLLNYVPKYRIRDGLQIALGWYRSSAV